MDCCADVAVENAPFFLVARQDVGIPTVFAGLAPKAGGSM